jgi:hypothetical protein
MTVDDELAHVAADGPESRHRSWVITLRPRPAPVPAYSFRPLINPGEPHQSTKQVDARRQPHSTRSIQKLACFDNRAEYLQFLVFQLALLIFNNLFSISYLQVEESPRLRCVA